MVLTLELTGHDYYIYFYHPAGDMTRVSVVLRKKTVKIGVDENWGGDAEIKIN